MKTLILYVAYLDQKLGRLTLLGLALIIFSFIFFAAFTLPAYQELKDMQTQSAQIRSSVRHREKIDIPVTTPFTFNAFYTALPPKSEVNNLLAKIFDAAYDNNLYLANIEYQEELVSSTQIIRYHMTVPVSGEYKPIRQFLNRVLQEMPNIALDSISFSREDVRNSEVDAKVLISLYLRKFPN